MEDCERLERCPFFRNIKCLPRTAEQLANSYCRGDNSGCARRWVLSAGERPPDDLFPKRTRPGLKNRLRVEGTEHSRRYRIGQEDLPETLINRSFPGFRSSPVSGSKWVDLAGWRTVTSFRQSLVRA